MPMAGAIRWQTALTALEPGDELARRRLGRGAAMSPHLSPDLVSDAQQLLAYTFMVHALIAASIVAVMAAVTGWFMVLRRESFAGHTLSVMAFPGAAAAILAGIPVAFGYFAFSGGAALVIGAGSVRRGRGGGVQAALTGTVQAAALALGFLLLGVYGGLLESPTSLLFGSFLGISATQVVSLAVLAVGVLAFFALVGRPLLFASVDGAVASAHRVPVKALSISFMVVLGLTAAAIAQVTGALLVLALLVAPPATAMQLTPRIGVSLLLSILTALVTVWLGLGLAYFTNYAAGFFITTVAFTIYLAARLIGTLAWRPRREMVGPRPPSKADGLRHASVEG